MPKNQIPEKYRCVITGMIMIDPVFTADGHTYEREAIEEWLKAHVTSPKTNKELEHKNLTCNHDKRGDILEFLESNPELYDGKEVYLPQAWKIQCVLAIKGNRLEEFQKLLNKDKRLLTTDLENDSTSFHLACEFSSPEFVEGLLKILSQRDEGISMMPETGRFNPIHLNVLLERTLVKKEYSKCELLLKLGAEIEQVETITHNTLFHRMIIRGNQEASNWLLDQKAALESRNSEGNTPLMLSVMHGHIKLTEFLLRMNANSNLTNALHKTPYYIAVEKGDIGMAKLLLENKANPIVSCGAAQLSTLHIAAKRGDGMMLQYLLQTKAADLINTQDDKGNTALHLAIQAGHNGIIHILLEAGASHKLKNQADKTPIDLSNRQQKEKILPLIVQTVKARSEPKLKEIGSLGQTVAEPTAEDAVIDKFLALVAAGEQDKAKAFLKNNPTLVLLLAGDLSELPKNVFMGAPCKNVRTLFIAARQNHVGAITALIKAGVDVDTLNKYGATPLCVAASKGHAAAITTLKSAGANVNATIPDGKTPVFIAAAAGHVAAIVALKLSGANVNTASKDGKTPLFIATYNGHAEAITALKAAGADVNAPCQGFPLVFIAAEIGHAAAITALKAAGANVNASNENGETAVYIAAYRDQVEAIDALKAAGAGMNIPNKKDGFTPVHIAAQQGHTAAINALKAAGADVNRPNHYGSSPIYIAAQQGNAASITALKAAGANVATPNHEGLTPLYIAAQQGHAAAISALKAAGANANAPNKNGNDIPVFVAAAGGHTAAIIALKSAGANLNAADKEGQTSVFIAAQNGHADAITILKSEGANVNTPDNDGHTPVYIAAQNNHAEAIRALKAAGADVNTPISDGATPVYIAAENGCVDAIIALKAAGANLNTACNNGGGTPVWTAACHGYAATITALKAAGANVNTPDNKGYTPVLAAAQNGNAAAISALLEAGADASIKGPRGTALEVARKGKEVGYKKIVKLLEAHFKQYPNGIKPVDKMNRVDVPAIPKKVKDHTLMDSLEKKDNKELRHSLVSDERENAMNLPSQAEIRAYAQEQGIPIIMPSGAAPAHGAQKSHQRFEKESKNEGAHEDKEKLRFILEKLKALFLNSKNLNITSENDEIYNECLKKINNNAQLVYKKAQNKYLLYVNDFALNNEDAVKAIEKMIEVLGGTSAKPTDTIRPNVNTSYQYEDNDIQAILSARLKQLQEQNPKLFIKPIKELGAVDDITGFELKNRLAEEAKTKSGSRICLIPCNLGNAHWVGMLLEFNERGKVSRARYIDPFTTHPTVPETFQSQLQKVYPEARFEIRALLQQQDNNSCGAYTIENLLIAALNIQSSKESESIRRMHLACLREYNSTFYQAFDERQRNNRPTTANIHEQLGYLEGLKSIWFSKPELSRILAIKQCLSNLPFEIQTTLVEVFKHNPAYNDDHALHLKTIRSVLQKTLGVESKALTELIQLLFELPLESGTPMPLEKLKFRVSYNEILAVSERHLLPQKINDLQKTLIEQIKADEEFAHKLQLELWSSVETPEINQENFKVKFSEIKTQMESQDGIPAAPAPGGPHELMFSQAPPSLPSIHINSTEEAAASAVMNSAQNGHTQPIMVFKTTGTKEISLFPKPASVVEQNNPPLLNQFNYPATRSRAIVNAGQDALENTNTYVSFFLPETINPIVSYETSQSSALHIATENSIGTEYNSVISLLQKVGASSAVSSIVESTKKLDPPAQKHLPQKPLEIKNNILEKTKGLIEAIKENNRKEVSRLLKLKIDSSGKKIINEVDREYGGNALYSAATFGHVHFIAPLIKAGADVNQSNNYGVTPVSIAAFNGHADIITALAAAGAAMDTRNHQGFTAVFVAAQNGHVAAITALKAAGADLNLADNDGTPPIYIAAQQGQVESINALRAAGAKMDAQLPNGRTPVFIAAQNGHAATIAALAAAGANLDIPEKTYNVTPVCIAAQSGHAEAIRALKTAGANMSTPNKAGATPLFIAAQNGHIKVIRELQATGTDVNRPDKGGITPVFMAAQQGHAEVITVLKALGANVNIANNNGFTPVYIAAYKGHGEVIAALKAVGADMNRPAIKNNHFAPIHVAAEQGHAAVITALKAAGAVMNTPLQDGCTPVHVAAQRGHVAAIIALKAAGVAMNTPEMNGGTPVYIAAQEGHAAVITALKTSGADVNTPMKDGSTPVYIAACKGNFQAILALKTAGANVNTPNRNGTTPVFIAAQNGRAEAIRALKAAGADMNTAKHDGVTPIFIAAAKGHAAVVKALLEAGVDASIEAPCGTTPLEIGRQGEGPGHKEVVKLLETHFKKCFNEKKLVADEESSRVQFFDVKIQQEPLSSVNMTQKLGSATAPSLIFSPLTSSYSDHIESPAVGTLNINLEDIQKFLRLIVEGEQDKAEAMLKSNPELALASGDVTDLSKRTFRGITGFQYSVWALDWHMWTMIRKYLPIKDAKLQAQEFETGSWIKNYGIHALELLNNLIKAYQITIKLFETEGDCDEAWIHQVGGAQRLLPVHVVNEYCHPTRRFSYPMPNFNGSSVLPRSRMIDKGEWFTAVHNGGKLGEKFAVYRAGPGLAWAIDNPESGDNIDSIRELSRVRIAQHEELISELNSKRVQRNESSKDVSEFLMLVAGGEQDRAEAMLQKDPNLALVLGDVTDLSRRTFKGITGLQYAVWALDWHMWTMIRKYLPIEEAKLQAQEFETGAWIKSHGINAERLLDNLIQTYQASIFFHQASKWTEYHKALKQIGQAQFLLPVHVVNEYCHPVRSFYPVPNFEDGLILPRSRTTDKGDWFTFFRNGDKENYDVICRSIRVMATVGNRVVFVHRSGKQQCEASETDYESICVLTRTRVAQYKEIITELKSKKGLELGSKKKPIFSAN